MASEPGLPQWPTMGLAFPHPMAFTNEEMGAKNGEKQIQPIEQQFPRNVAHKSKQGKWQAGTQFA
jgi:hypothetical protein